MATRNKKYSKAPSRGARVLRGKTVLSRTLKISKLVNGRRSNMDAAKDGTEDLNGIEGTALDMENDQTVRAYLDLLDEDIKKHPERLVPLSKSYFARAQELVGDLEVDLDEELLPENE